MATLENDPDVLVTVLVNSVAPKAIFTVTWGEKPAPETNTWLLGGPTVGESEIDWLQAEVASATSPNNKQQSRLRLCRQVMFD